MTKERSSRRFITLRSRQLYAKSRRIVIEMYSYFCGNACFGAIYNTLSTLTFRSPYDSFSRRPRRTEGEIVRPAAMARNPIDCQAQIRDSGRCTRDFSPAPLTRKFSIASGTLRILPMSRNFGDRKSSKSGLTLDISQLFKRVTEIFDAIRRNDKIKRLSRVFRAINMSRSIFEISEIFPG